MCASRLLGTKRPTGKFSENYYNTAQHGNCAHDPCVYIIYNIIQNDVTLLLCTGHMWMCRYYTDDVCGKVYCSVHTNNVTSVITYNNYNKTPLHHIITSKIVRLIKNSFFFFATSIIKLSYILPALYFERILYWVQCQDVPKFRKYLSLKCYKNIGRTKINRLLYTYIFYYLTFHKINIFIFERKNIIQT